MAEYQITSSDDVIRNVDMVFIIKNSDTPEWQEYEEWLANGGVPDPYVPPPPFPPPSQEDQVLFDHENRLRSMEGQPPLEFKEFVVNTMGKRMS